MFTTKRTLERRAATGELPRQEYLQRLITEYQTTQVKADKVQILANVANFAYDPVNYEYLRALNAVDLFVDCLTEDDEQLVEFGLGGLCNMACDPAARAAVLENAGIPAIKSCLSSKNPNTVRSALTTLMFLVAPESEKAILTAPLREALLIMAKSGNVILANLAKVFLQDYYHDYTVM